jgi:hypothetical protein
MRVIGSDQSAYTLTEVRAVIGRCVDFFWEVIKTLY